jgi:hypothetical protein
MKVGFIVNIHISAMRPVDCLKEYLESLEQHINHDYHVYIIDNGSDKQYNLDDCTIKDRITYEYIEDQWKGGITGAWNTGTKLAIEDGCKILFGYNDDLIWNDTVNNFISYMKETYDDDKIFGPVSNNGGNSQTYDNVQDWIRPIHQLHGFLWCFTDKLYHKVKNDNGDFLHVINNTTDGKWGGQEDIIASYKRVYNIEHIVYGPWWIYHKRFHLWKEAREFDNGNEHHVKQYKGKIK